MGDPGSVSGGHFNQVFQRSGHGFSLEPRHPAKGGASSRTEFGRVGHLFSPPFKTKKPLAWLGKWPLMNTLEWSFSDLGAIGLLNQTVIGERVIPVVGHRNDNMLMDLYGHESGGSD